MGRRVFGICDQGRGAAGGASRRRTGADGIFEQEARRGLITYKQSLERIDGELQAFEGEGHGDYAEVFVLPAAPGSHSPPCLRPIFR